MLLSSGHEERNTRWADSRRRYNAGTGVHSIADLHTLIDFFEERRGRLYGFRWRDRGDWKSCPPDETPAAGRPGDRHGRQRDRRLPAREDVWRRHRDPIAHDREAGRRARCALRSTARQQTEGTDFLVDTATGIVTFQPGHVPDDGAAVTAGFEFDVPVRFDTDQLTMNLSTFEAGDVPNVPVVEIRI